MNDKGFATGRSTITREQFERLEKAKAVVLDHQRSRPLWFDGRFLKAEDLTREQEYFLSRQAGLALVTGVGIIEGLMVRESADSYTSIEVLPGHGITSGGERVVLDHPLTVNLANTPVIQDLNVMFRKGREAMLPLRQATGTYIVMLRPVEYAANPIASYPARVDADRKGEDGEIVEATIVTLTPFPIPAGSTDPLRRRAHAAHQVFCSGGGFTIPPQALPLALVDLDGGSIKWVDTWIVRREAAAGRSDVLGFGLAPRPLREAFLLQYLDMLQDVADYRHRRNKPQSFAATDHFLSIPPAGRLPSAAVNPDKVIQYYFPADMPVTLSFIPDDELPLLVEESLVLPPIDFQASAAELAATPVMIAVPIPRNKMEMLRKGLVPSFPLTHPAVATPRLAALNQLSLYRNRVTAADAASAASVSAIPPAWREVMSNATNLWYLRRASLSVADAPPQREAAADDRALENRLYERLAKINAVTRVKNLIPKGTTAAAHAMIRTLASRSFMLSDPLTLAFIDALEKAANLHEALVLDLTEGFRAPSVVTGLRILEDRVFNQDVSTAEGAAKKLETTISLISKLDITKLAASFSAIPSRELGGAATILKDKLAAGVSSEELGAAIRPFITRVGG